MCMDFINDNVWCIIDFLFLFLLHNWQIMHASAHGGLSANGLSDICLSFVESIL